MTLEERYLELEAALARSQEETRAAKERYDMLMRSIPIGVAIVSPDGTIEEVNDRYLESIPFARREAIVGKPLRERLTRLFAKIYDVEPEGATFTAQQRDQLEYRIGQYIDPTQIPDEMEYSVSSDLILRSISSRDQNHNIVQIFDNITKLRQGEQRIINTIELMPAAIAIFDNNQTLIFFNDNFLKQIHPDLRSHCTIGKTYVEITVLVFRSATAISTETFGADAHAAMSDAEIEALAAKRIQMVSDRQEPSVAEYTTWDNRTIRSRANRSADGDVVIVAVDVTSERRTNRSLAVVLENIDGAVFLFDEHLRLTFWSPSAAKLFGFLGEILTEGMHSDQVREAIAAMAVPEDRTHFEGIYQLTYVRRLLDGRAIQIRRVPTPDGGLLVVCNDVTELQRTNLLASRAERIESLGRLVAGVAHEINTPLGVGVTTASYLERLTHEMVRQHAETALTESELTSFLTRTDEAASLLLRNVQRAAELVAHFKRVSVGDLSNERSRFRLTQVIADVERLLTRALQDHSLRLEVDCPGDLSLDSYPGAYMQIFTNLISNSLAHAYPDGRPGVLSLTARMTDGALEIRYRDDGDGVAPELLGRIFEHFFTTRRGRGGTGLGLSVVHNLVTELLGGEIEAASPPLEGLGIRFVVPQPNVDTRAEQIGLRR